MKTSVDDYAIKTIEYVWGKPIGEYEIKPYPIDDELLLGEALSSREEKNRKTCQ